MGQRTASRHGLAAILLALTLAVTPAKAEVGQVRTATQLGLTFLAFMVMQHDKLVEKQARALGLGEIQTSWTRFADGGAINDALVSGSIDFAPNGVPVFLIVWDKTFGNLDVRAIGAFNALTLSLLAREPRLRSIADFTPTDRIALPGVQSSSQAILLEMAAERAFGAGNARRLDPLTVSRGHPDAIAAFLSGSSEITAHFSAPPFVERELQDPAVHTILTSRDVYHGAGSTGIVYATSAFCTNNPKTCQAYFAALGEAIDIIHKDRRHAAEAYIAQSQVKETVAAVEHILQGPDAEFDVAPKGLMMVAEFLHRIGTIKRQPGSWRELMFPVAADLPGN